MAGPKTLTFAQQKGGTGKTVSVCWMAWMLSQRHRVAVVDLDSQGATTTLLGVEDTYVHGAYDFMIARDVPKDAVVRSKLSNCMLLPATDALVMAEMDNRVQSLNFEEVRSRLQRAFQSFDYILIDCSSGLGILTSLAMTLADKIVMPVFQATLEIRALNGTFDHVSRMRRDASDVTVVLPVMTEQDDLVGFDDVRRAIPVSSVAIPYDADAVSQLSSLSSHSDVDTANPMMSAYFAFIHELEGDDWSGSAETEIEPTIVDDPVPEPDLNPAQEAQTPTVEPRTKARKQNPEAETMTDIFDALHEKRSRASEEAQETLPEDKPRAPRSNSTRKRERVKPPLPTTHATSAPPPTYQSLRDIHHDTLDEAPKVQTWFWLRLGLALIGIGVAIIGIFTDLIGPLAMWGAVIGVLILIMPDLIMRFLLKDR